MSADQQQQARDSAVAPQDGAERSRADERIRTGAVLPGDTYDRWRASGVSLPELVRRGLDVAEPDQLADLRQVVREAVAAELDARGIGPGNGLVAKPSRVPSWPSR